MKISEIVRIFVISLLGAILMIVVQPWLYTSKWLWKPQDANDLETALSLFVDKHYFPGNLYVLIASIFATIVWCLMSNKSRASRAEEIAQWRLYWWLMGLIPFISILIATFVTNKKLDASLSLFPLFLLDMLLLYWLPTATSTPGLLIYTPPLANQVHNLMAKFGIDD